MFITAITPGRFAQADYAKARPGYVEVQKASFLTDRALKLRPMRPLILLGAFCLVISCGGMANRKPGLQIKLSDIQINEKAVEQMAAHFAVPVASCREEIPEALKSLLSFLAQTPPESLVESSPHAQSGWRLDQIYLLDDCVAVQFAEGHYLETIFFVRNPKGWRIAGRVRPEDHQ